MSRSSQFCGFPRGESVEVGVGASGVAHVMGIQRCGSPWACPMCAPVVRERRALEISEAVRSVEDSDGGGFFVTLTVRHHRGDALQARLAAVSEALHLCLRGAAWERRRDSMQYIGSIRTVEVTRSDANGWHAHLHALLLCSKPVGEARGEDLRAWLYGRWSHICEQRGFGTLSEAHGVDVRPLRRGEVEGLGGYLAKVEAGWGVGRELARSDVKRPSTAGLVPVDLLDEVLATGDTRAAALWQEYERATFGKRAIVWSRGLRARLLGAVEATDAELAAVEEFDFEDGERVMVATVPGEVWWRAVVEGWAPALLEQIEDAAVVSLFLGSLGGRAGLRAGP